MWRNWNQDQEKEFKEKEIRKPLVEIEKTKIKMLLFILFFKINFGAQKKEKKQNN